MKTVVAYASKYGSTKGIAEFIAEKLRQQGTQADAQEVSQVHNLEDYDAFVIGSAVYMANWLKEATEFVMRNRAVLASHPVWLFSSGLSAPRPRTPKVEMCSSLRSRRRSASSRSQSTPVTIKSSSAGWTPANSRSDIGWSERCLLPAHFFPRAISATGTTSMHGPSASLWHYSAPFLLFFCFEDYEADPLASASRFSYSH